MILVVGGAGYIGSHTVKQLVKNGNKVVVFDNLSSGHHEFIKWGVPFVLGDLANKEQLRLLFAKFPIQAVIHFAAHAYVGESVTNPEKYYLNNVRNTLNLLEVMNEHQVDKIVFSSTCATYGNPLEVSITEIHPQNPINPYGRTKLMVEHILEDYSRAYNLNYVILRYFNAAGADLEGEIGEWHDPETHLIPLVLDVAMKKKTEITVFGTDYATLDGTCIRDYIHVDDLASAHIKALQYLTKVNKSNVFNLGNGQGYSVRDIIATAEKITGTTIKVKESSRRPGDPPVLIGSNEKAKRELDWEPKNSEISVIMLSAWEWHKKLWG